jgi:hypothetical protein
LRVGEAGGRNRTGSDIGNTAIITVLDSKHDGPGFREPLRSDVAVRRSIEHGRIEGRAYENQPKQNNEHHSRKRTTRRRDNLRHQHKEIQELLRLRLSKR